MARSARPRPRRMDPAAPPRRRGPRVGAQKIALPAAAPVRADRPPCPPHDRSCGSHATGPGQGSSPPHSHACKRSQPRQADRGAAGAATDGHPWDTQVSACPQTAHQPPTERARTTVNTPIATRHAPTHPISTARRAPRDRYCKRRDSAPTARSRLIARSTVIVHASPSVTSGIVPSSTSLASIATTASFGRLPVVQTSRT